MGVSFAVNDDLTVTWDQSSADKSGSTVSEDTTSSFSYLTQWDQ